MSGEDEAVAIDSGSGVDPGKKTWSQVEKTVLAVYEFTDMIRESCMPLLGKRVVDVVLGFVPPDHPDRGLIDMGWRVLFYFEDEEKVLCINPTAAYSQAFMTAAPEDIKSQMLLDRLNKSHAEGRVKVIRSVEKEGEEKDE